MPNSQIKAIYAALEDFAGATQEMYESCCEGRDRWDESGRVGDWSERGEDLRRKAKRRRNAIHKSAVKAAAKITHLAGVGVLDAVDELRGKPHGQFAFGLALDLRESTGKFQGMFDARDDSWERLGAIKAIKTKFLGHLNTVSAALAIKPASPAANARPANDTASEDDPHYPARWFTAKTMISSTQLRNAVSRNLPLHRKKTPAGTITYSVSDARKLWPDGFPARA